MNSNSGELVKVLRPKYLPITSPVQTELLAIVRSELRPAPVQRKPPKDAAQSRLDFEAALTHRPWPDRALVELDCAASNDPLVSE